MHPTLLQALASQRTAETRAAAASAHQQPVLSRKPAHPDRPARSARPVRYRVGWALVEVGLRLAVARERT
jgi:hypothetical protein